MSKIKIYMGIPSLGERSDLQVYALRAIEKKYAGKVELVYPENLVQRIWHDYARNGYVDQFLSSDCDMIWFLDADVSPPENILDLVVNHGAEWKLAGAPYPVFMCPTGSKQPSIVYTVYKSKGDDRMYPASIPKEGTDWVDGIATGCIFIKREVFERLEKPYFEFKYDKETRHLVEGEDLGFCKKVAQLGYKFFIDYSMVCKHYKKVELLEVNNYAIEYANTQILAYDAMVRATITRKRLGLDSKSGLVLPK